MDNKKEIEAYKSGQCTGLERAALFLMQDAKAYFEYDNDTLANALRVLAKRLQNMADGERKELGL